MARMRSLKPEFWHDRKLARTVSRDARMLYLGLWNQADEWGRANADPRVVLGQVFPYEDDLAETDIERLLKELAGAGRVVLYDVDGDPFLFIPTLARHQRLEPNKVPSRHPAPPAEPPDETDPQAPGQQVHAALEPDPSGAQTGSAPDPGGIRAKHVAGSREHEAGSREHETTSSSDRAPRSAPTTRGTRIPDPFVVDDQMRSWAHEQGWADRWIDQITASFVDYWRGKPGAGGVKVDWPATWRNWLRKEAGPPADGITRPPAKPSWEL